MPAGLSNAPVLSTLLFASVSHRGVLDPPQPWVESRHEGAVARQWCDSADSFTDPFSHVRGSPGENMNSTSHSQRPAILRSSGIRVAGGRPS